MMVCTGLMYHTLWAMMGFVVQPNKSGAGPMTS